MKGLFLVDRSVFQRAFFKDEPYTEREAWLWLISAASYKKRAVRTKKGVVNLERGQLSHSTRFMAEKWQWKEPRVRRFLKRLKIDASIDAVNDAVQNIITICNYDTYQNFDMYSDAVNDTTNDAVPTQCRRSSDAKKNKGITNGITNGVTNDSNSTYPKYVFEGKFVRLNFDDFQAWKKIYSAIPDFRAMLHSADSWIGGKSEKEQKKWYPAVSQYLNNQHQKHLTMAKQNPPPETTTKAGWEL